MNPLMTSPNKRSLSVRLHNFLRSLKAMFQIAFITTLNATVGALFRWRLANAIAKGDTLWLDDLESTNRKHEFDAALPKADIRPNQAKRSKKSRAMKLKAYPEPTYPFAYRELPTSGNWINGLGESTVRPASKVFHTITGDTPWNGLERFNQVTTSWAALRLLFNVIWQDRHRDGMISAEKHPVNDPAQMATHVKEAAKQFGAALVGITDIPAAYTFEQFDPAPYTSAICIGVPMELEAIYHAPTQRSSVAAIAAYDQVSAASVALAQRIRQLGWNALAASNLGHDTDEVLHLPLAIQAGLGQLGKHGSIITKELGSNLRLATVLTDMPLAHDKPIDIGVDDFCARCQICTSNCPPQAIFDDKQMVRGIEKWYVDFDKCAPYFAANHSCGICVAVCPWTAPGRGESISLKMLAQRAEKER